MDLSPGEEAIINLLRGQTAVDFTLNVAWLGAVWTVSLSSEGDGIMAGRGDTFRQALQLAFGIEAGGANGGEKEPVPRPVLRLVGRSAAPLPAVG